MILILIITVLTAADQAVKYIVFHNIAQYETIPFIPGLISFTHIRNTGAAFGMFEDTRWPLTVMSLIILGVLIFIYFKYGTFRENILMKLSFGLIAAGAVGNLIDRVLRGYVIDFIKTDFIDFAIFNLADSFVVVGSILCAFIMIFCGDSMTKKDEITAITIQDNETEQSQAVYTVRDDEV